MKTLVIGHGSIGARHARIAKSLAWDVAVVSRQANLPYKNFNTIQTALDEFTPEAVVVATETTEHYRCICELERYARDLKILVEKPLFDRKVNFEAKNNSYFVAYNLRFHPVYRKIRQEIQNERTIFAHITCGSYLPDWRMGRDYRESYSASIERGGGVLNDLSHEIDCALGWFGASELRYCTFGNSGTLKIQSEDYASIILTNNSNTKVFLHMDYLSRIPFRRGIIQCETKTLLYDFIEKSVQISGREKEYFDCETDLTYLEQLKALQNNPHLMCTLEEGKQIISLISEIKERN